MQAEKVVKEIFTAYESGKEFKEKLGKKGMFKQNKINERFFRGDQWHGAKCGNLPLVRHNIIKRIGDYKVANISANPISVAFSAEGIANTVKSNEQVKGNLILAAEGNMQLNITDEGQAAEPNEINFVMSALSEYFDTTAERLKFETLKANAAEKAFKSGTAILYSYWDNSIETGLYVDSQNMSQIIGDVNCKLINVENFYVENVFETDLQKQEYIIISSRENVASLKREAKANGISASVIGNIKADDGDINYGAGDVSEEQKADLKLATVLTKFWFKENENGKRTVHAIKVVNGATIRKEWDTRLKRYPFSVFRWEEMESSFYGDSEVTYLVPNQIAINRMLSSCVWAAILQGMPIAVVNGNVVDLKNKPITNEPGQIISAASDDLRNVMSYINPPNISGDFINASQSIITNTLEQSGANNAALGNIRPDNMSAIIAVREAALQPLQTLQNKFYQFCEDAARNWADYWINYYGTRKIKIKDNAGTWYLPINADRYQNLLISAKVDVGPASLYSEIQTVQTLDNLLNKGALTLLQYLERMPKGYVPDLQKLIDELKAAQSTPTPTLPTDTPTSVPQGEGGIPSEENILSDNAEEMPI